MKNVLSAMALGSLMLISGCFSSPSEKANALYVEAVQLAKEAQEPGMSTGERPQAYIDASENIQRILSKFPSTDIAVALSSGQTQVSGLSPEKLYSVADKARISQAAMYNELAAAYMIMFEEPQLEVFSSLAIGNAIARQIAHGSINTIDQFWLREGKEILGEIDPAEDYGFGSYLLTQVGSVLAQEGDIESAVRLAESHADLLSGTNEEAPLRVKLMNYGVDLQVVLGDMETAREISEELLAEPGYWGERIDIQRRLMLDPLMYGKTKKVGSSIKSYDTLVDNLENPRRQAEHLNHSAYHHRVLNNPDRALYQGRRALEIWRELDGPAISSYDQIQAYNAIVDLSTDEFLNDFVGSSLEAAYGLQDNRMRGFALQNASAYTRTPRLRDRAIQIADSLFDEDPESERSANWHSGAEISLYLGAGDMQRAQRAVNVAIDAGVDPAEVAYHFVRHGLMKEAIRLVAQSNSPRDQGGTLLQINQYYRSVFDHGNDGQWGTLDEESLAPLKQMVRDKQYEFFQKALSQ